jgi:hypothetical protein
MFPSILKVTYGNSQNYRKALDMTKAKGVIDGITFDFVFMM